MRATWSGKDCSDDCGVCRLPGRNTREERDNHQSCDASCPALNAAIVSARTWDRCKSNSCSTPVQSVKSIFSNVAERSASCEPRLSLRSAVAVQTDVAHTARERRRPSNPATSSSFAKIRSGPSILRGGCGGLSCSRTLASKGRYLNFVQR